MTNYIPPKQVFDYKYGRKILKCSKKSVESYIHKELGGGNYRDLGITKDPNGNTILYGILDD